MCLHHVHGLDAVAGRDLRGTGVDRRPARGVLDGDLDDAALLLIGQAEDLPRAAEHEDRVHTTPDHVVQQVPQGLLHEFAVLGQGRDHRRDDSGRAEGALR